MNNVFVSPKTQSGFVWATVREHSRRWAVVRSDEGIDEHLLTFLFFDTRTGNRIASWTPSTPRMATEAIWRLDCLGRFPAIYSKDANSIAPEEIQWFGPETGESGTVALRLASSREASSQL